MPKAKNKGQLSSIFESDLLDAETKEVVKEAWDAAIEANRAELELDYADKLNEATRELTEKSLSMVEEAIASEMDAITEELADARTLEVQYGEKLQAFKEEYAAKTDELVNQLVESTVSQEMEELKEDIEFAKKHEFVMEMFNSFQKVYESFNGESDIDVHKQLEESQAELEKYRRKEVMEGLLSNVSGDKRQVVATILEGVATDRLEAKFESLRSVLLKESATDGEEKPIEESASTKTTGDEEPTGTVVMETTKGNDEPIEESVDAIQAKLRNSLRVFKNK